MAGRRLLDAAKLFTAARSVASQHAALRKDQWNVFVATSSLARAVKSQTDRVTVTLSAARELGKRFAEGTPPVWDSQGQDEQSQNSGRRGNTAYESSATAQGRENLETARKTVDYSAATAKSTAARGLDNIGLDTAAQKISGDDGTLSSLRRRELQRQAENQIPHVAADAQATPEPAEQLGRDTFNARGRTSSPELSSLPRSKIPKTVDASSSVGDSSGNPTINHDIFPTPEDRDGRQAQTGSVSLTPDSVVETGLFTSPRVSRMLGSSGSGVESPYAKRQRAPPQPLPEMVQASERWAKEREQADAAEQSSATSVADQPKPTSEDAETQDLAASLAQDVQTQHAAASLPHEPESKPYEMRESRVPSSRFGRIWQYGGLATSMALGAVGEGIRRFAGGSKDGSVMLSESNINRLVAKLSRMRGAALKLGQMMSFQDSNFLPPTINAVLQRVQDSADYMPSSQRDKVLVRNLGQEWRELFTNFEEKPFAAASIGQVHKATLKSSGQDVAVKIQYPGVRNSIDSDLNNLSLLLTASQLLPKGLYLDKTIANARTELAWECDYEREAKAGIRFKDELLADEHDIFAVPTVYLDASGPDVLTAEFMHGTAVTKIHDLTQAERDWIGTQILRICWRELMEWRFMQTDPNWTNFLYNRATKKVELLDFGASRDFPDKFVVPYVELLIAASKGDRAACRDRSIELGYLTGHEGKSMLDAHVDSIMVLAEPFMETAPDVYSFENQTITDRVRANIGLMLRERLSPPPEETYSLHRKLSGAFLLCARLKSRVRTREMFARAVDVWNGRAAKVDVPST